MDGHRRGLASCGAWMRAAGLAKRTCFIEAWIATWSLHSQLELDGALHRLDEDDDLVELERVEQLVELAVLLVLLELDVVLLEAVQRQLRVVDVDLHRVLHKLLADGAESRIIVVP